MSTSDEDFASLLQEYEGAGQKARKDPKPGEEVRGRIVSIGRDSVFVDVGGKSDGVLDAAELRDDNGKLSVAVGDEIEARVVESSDGTLVLRRTLGRGSAVAESDLNTARESGIPVEGLVSAVNKGGLEVQLAGGVRAFCPTSQVELRPGADLQSFVGQRLQFKVTRVARDARRLDVVLSRRALLEAEQASRAEGTRAKLALGAVLRGKVTAIKDFGAFVDLGGIEGLIPTSELTFSRNKPQDVVAVGQEVEVAVTRIEKTDDPRKPERVALSLKALEQDPWADVRERFPDGAKLSGVVSRLEQFGAFVELAPGIEGLVHISELGGGKRIRHPKEAVRAGERVDVVVLDVDVPRRRISLGMGGGSDEGREGDAPVTQAPAKLGTLADLFNRKR
jgi:small subunit ribosomal protein S1